MPADVFFDTNILIYAVAQNDARGPVAEALLAKGGVIGVQGLNEFVSVVRRKMGMSWKEVDGALDAILTLCPSPIPLTLATHETGRGIAEDFGYGIYDALVAAAALETRCSTLLSEDFQDGQILYGKLRIRNPFK
ncbi:MAG TPA: PIN domain-containing protein [Candidatus Sulfotelmatobacter sp.]|nr:PIN domain-containing protein [Candidatus Sulfotelmatobacter sp.]